MTIATILSLGAVSYTHLNCIYVGSDNTHLLVDVGISGKRVEQGLNSLDSILSYCLMKENVESLSSYMDVSENLARRIINQQNLLLSFSQSVLSLIHI